MHTVCIHVAHSLFIMLPRQQYGIPIYGDFIDQMLQLKKLAGCICNTASSTIQLHMGRRKPKNMVLVFKLISQGRQLNPKRKHYSL